MNYYYKTHCCIILLYSCYSKTGFPWRPRNYINLLETPMYE